MRLNARIVSIILSSALALGVMGFAAFAATSQYTASTNTIRFVSNYVYATVTGTVSGAVSGTY